MIADIAVIFHWPLSELLAMDVMDLLHWRKLAVARWNRLQSGKDEE